MEITAFEEDDEHLTWKEGWPQPGEDEKGNGGVEVKGGQTNPAVAFFWSEKHDWAALETAKNQQRMNVTTRRWLKQEKIIQDIEKEMK